MPPRVPAIRTTALLAVALTIGACGDQKNHDGRSPGEPAAVLRVGDQLQRLRTLVHAAGEDQPKEYRLEWTNFLGGPAIIAAETGGSLDAGWMAETPLIFSQAAGSPVKVVAAASPANAQTSAEALVVATHSPIRTVRDLKGKKILYLPGTAMQYFLLQLLEREGLSLSDVETVNAPGSLGAAAALLESGRIDAVILPDPMLVTAQDAGKVRQLAATNAVKPGALYVVVPTRLLEDAAACTRLADFIAGMARSYQWQADNPDTAAAAIAKLYGVTTDQANTMLFRSQMRFRPIDDQLIADQQMEADTFHRIGLIKTKLNVADIFSRRFNDIILHPEKGDKP
jgi:sulfonate transport system substrate-binding protein